MELRGRKILAKLKDKNRGNVKLIKAIDSLITKLELMQPTDSDELESSDVDFDKVYGGEFYFVDIHIHRALLMIKIYHNEVWIVWAGNHDEYERTFKNNKHSVEKWLRKNNLIY